MAITYKKLARGWEATCGDCKATGGSAFRAIENAHEAWWNKHKEEVATTPTTYPLDKELNHES